MKLLFSAGRKEKKDRRSRRAPCLHENALFWVFLLLLSIGCITKLYEKTFSVPASSSQVFSAGAKAQGRNYTVKDRELPIYCVETEKPQVALSFDAACGRGKTGFQTKI